MTAKRCPFCGSDSVVMRSLPGQAAGGGIAKRMACEATGTGRGCGAEGPIASLRLDDDESLADAALKGWNRRVR